MKCLACDTGRHPYEPHGATFQSYNSDGMRDSPPEPMSCPCPCSEAA